MLYAATGDSGRLYTIDAQGNSTLLFDSPESPRTAWP